ncbi:DUF2865 domain-containing protein [Manganibacter manganicus]|uniref:DUF2865 domain-containing protein n=1 Tax=Manganibacter manganicus TaxID=1873176 RepID=UPI0009B94A2E|nr:DUF2865 domain-containing protein [Pseudaminobacter manganicus]
MKGSGKRLALAATLLGILATMAPAHGATRTCHQLESALIAASRSAATPTAIRAYDKAIHRQNMEIKVTRDRAREIDCGFSLFSRNIRQCAILNTSIQRMETNLDTLHRKRQALAQGGSMHVGSRIRAEMEVRGCREKPIKVGSVKSVAKALSADASSDPIARNGTASVLDIHGSHIVVLPNAYGRGAGDFRTTCVRTCDGYFFPMSNAATLGDFQRDQANCESACPGTEMQIFYQRGMNGDTANMLSAATGRAYSELSTAYRYKRLDIERSPACGCNAARPFSIIGGTSSRRAATSLESLTGSSSILTEPSQSEAESLAAQTAIPQSGSETTERASDKHKIRVVGPRFFPDPKAAIDLQVPAPIQGR